MSCCGEKRSGIHPAGHGGRGYGPVAGRAGPAPRKLQFSVEFEYLGNTGLTVQGPVTGRRYRFPRPGAVAEVDLRDRVSLARVPKLRQVPNWQRR